MADNIPCVHCGHSESDHEEQGVDDRHAVLRGYDISLYDCLYDTNGKGGKGYTPDPDVAPE